MNKLDMQGLADEFETEVEFVDITTFKETLDKVRKIEDPERLLSAIIEKAGTFLDLIEKEVVNGNMNERYMEVASTMLSTLTNTVNSVVHIYSIQFNNKLENKKIKQKDRELDLKDWVAKKQLENNPDNNTTNNVLVMDRETLLKQLKITDIKQIE